MCVGGGGLLILLTKTSGMYDVLVEGFITLVITCMMIRSVGKAMECDCTSSLEASFTALSGKVVTGATWKWNVRMCC